MKQNYKVPPSSVANEYIEPDCLNFLALGFNLGGVPYVEQMDISSYVTSEVEIFAQNIIDGYLESVYVVDGFLQIIVQCKYPDKALKSYLSKLSNGEIEIFEMEGYAKIGSGDPLLFMLNKIDEIYGENYVCKDCLKAMQKDGVEVIKQ